MRVLHINKRYPPHVGGVERHLRDLAQCQSDHPEVEVEVLCVAEPAGRGLGAGRECPRDVWERDGRVTVHRVGQVALVASNPISPGVVRELSRSRSRRAHDVWHFHYPFPTGEAACLWQAASRWRGGGGAPPPRQDLPVTVCTYHSDFVGESGLKRLLAAPYAHLTRAFLASVDRILVSSPQLASNSRFLPTFADKVRVVPFGIDPAVFARTPERARAALRLRERFGTPLVLFVGRLVPYKGVEVLLEACARLRADTRATPGRVGFGMLPCSLVIVGEGPLRASLQTRAAELELGERVRFVGTVSDDELVTWYHAADMLVLPSVTPNEAFGLVQLEAHACGVPVVSTNLPTGVPYANAHGVSGLVVPPGDAASLAEALGMLLRDPELRAELGRRARARLYSDFTLRGMTQRVLDVYRELLDARAHGQGEVLGVSARSPARSLS